VESWYFLTRIPGIPGGVLALFYQDSWYSRWSPGIPGVLVLSTRISGI
jgi:hypothetical protein